MRRTASRFTVFTATAAAAAAALIGVAAPTAWADNPSPKHDQANQAPDSSSSSSPSSSAKAPEGWVLLEEDLVMLTVNEPQNHFIQADRDLARNDPKAAAAELHIAAGYMDMQASRAQGDDKQQLTKAADDVRKTADDLTRGNAKDPAQLKQAFTRADLALARHFQSKASDELQKKTAVRAGHDLQGAADAFDAAVAWSGRPAPAQAASAVADARRLAAQLIIPQSSANSNGATGEARTAGAKVGGSAQQHAQGGDIPQNASKTAQALGDAIQKFADGAKADANGSAKP